MRIGIAQRQGNADRRCVAYDQHLSSRQPCAACARIVHGRARVWICSWAGMRAPSSSRVLIVLQGVINDWVSSRAAGLGVRRIQAAFTARAGKAETGDRALQGACRCGLQPGLMVMECKSKMNVMKIARIRLGSGRDEWADGRPGTARQLRSPTLEPCGVGRFSASGHASSPIKAVLGVLQNTQKCQSVQIKCPASPAPERRLGRRYIRSTRSTTRGHLCFGVFPYVIRGIL